MHTSWTPAGVMEVARQEHRKATYERVGPPGGDLVLLGGGVVLQGRGVGTKRGQNTFYSIQQTQSLICKSDNTPNYQVNMAILYGRWKEVSIWLPESETALPSPLGSEEDGLHIDIIKGGQNSCIFPGPNDHPRPKTAPPMTAAGDFNAHTSHMEDTHTPPRGGQPAEESTPLNMQGPGNTLEECIIQHGN
ncbi:hypothetical protein MTP99_011238 [Tenebrio molitor]|nr:hypothetical protein MTP99_011238 [Tenebrio molitor]